jgi:hypothetical protein
LASPSASPSLGASSGGRVPPSGSPGKIEANTVWYGIYWVWSPGSSSQA